ncbi:hypothetical protein JW948_02210 [bacterium]|nr:hypothetical protein [bacterium]
MLNIKKTFIVDDNNRKVAVQVDIDTFHRIEEVLENYALYHLIQETSNEEVLSVKDAKAFYNNLEKSS